MQQESRHFGFTVRIFLSESYNFQARTPPRGKLLHSSNLYDIYYRWWWPKVIKTLYKSMTVCARQRAAFCRVAILSLFGHFFRNFTFSRPNSSKGITPTALKFGTHILQVVVKKKRIKMPRKSMTVCARERAAFCRVAILAQYCPL